MATITKTEINPAKIMQIGLGFWASKIVLTAVSLGLFTRLANKELSAEAIRKDFGLHQRGIYDFLDALVALGFLKRTGLRETSLYSNSDDVEYFLDREKPTYIGGILEMANNRLYGFWNDLEEALRTGLPQNETKNGGKSLFEDLYSSEAQLTGFIRAMGGIQMGNFVAFSNQFDFSDYTTLCDIGGAGGDLSAQVALNNGHMTCVSFDLPPVTPVVTGNINSLGLGDRVTIQEGDFFKDEFPDADVITMGNVLHDWGLREKKILIKKAYNALPVGGALVVIESIIDDDRSANAFGLMMSLNMLIETPGGFDFSGEDFRGWATEIGFKDTYTMPLTGPSSALIAIK